MLYNRQPKPSSGKHLDSVGDVANIVTHPDEPTSYEDAMSHPEADLWKQACDREITALKSLRTFDIAATLADHRVVGSQWTFKLKCGPDGEIVLYKAWLAAKGYSEVPGVDFDETFMLALKKLSLLALLAYAAHLNLKIHQMDVKSAFLNGILKEEIYMEVPPGLPIPDGMVFHLKKTIYGL
jgi:Reverse transcriptase (RNA-dependent DNA polymerase)